MIKVVILDGHVTNPGDLSWKPIQELCELTVFPRSKSSEIVQRAKDAEVIITNKCVIDRSVMNALPNLQCVLLLATGYNNIDLIAARAKSIQVFNAVGYSSNSVAQQVFAYMLHHCNQVQNHSDDVRNMGWSKATDWSYSLNQTQELADKTIGIYGFGRIGRQVAKIAMAFGMNVLSHHKHPNRDSTQNVKFVSMETLFSNSNFITLHAPLTDSNKHIINYNLLKHANKATVLINTGRGDLIDNKGLIKALNEGFIASVYLDVLDHEPPAANHILTTDNRCYVTPHHAWATVSARKRLILLVAQNLRNFTIGNFSASLS